MLDELKNFDPQLSIPTENMLPAIMNLLLRNVALSQATLQAVSTVATMIAVQLPSQARSEMEKVADKIIESYEHEVMVNLEETKTWLLAKYGE